jgi:hypothetical protein
VNPNGCPLGEQFGLPRLGFIRPAVEVDERLVVGITYDVSAPAFFQRAMVKEDAGCPVITLAPPVVRSARTYLANKSIDGR